MGCKSALYAANTAAQALSIGNVVSFGSPVRRFGCNVTASGGNVVIRGVGYYMVMPTITITNTSDAAATPAITFYKNGVAVTGAVSTNTIAAGATETVDIPAFIVKEVCDCECTLTAVLSGAAVTLNNAAVSVVKV